MATKRHHRASAVIKPAPGESLLPQIMGSLRLSAAQWVDLAHRTGQRLTPEQVKQLDQRARAPETGRPPGKGELRDRHMAHEVVRLSELIGAAEAKRAVAKAYHVTPRTVERALTAHREEAEHFRDAYVSGLAQRGRLVPTKTPP